MALSRIWSAFIIIAFAVACVRVATGGSQGLFGAMVSGKAGDTLKLRTADTATLSPALLHQMDSSKTLAQGRSSVMRGKDGQLQYYQILASDGLFETCKGAVNIAIGLIGIMAFFMGMMSIADAAGGVRFLSRIIGPFFSRLFPELPKDHPAMGHMMLNFSANLLGLDNVATPFGIKAMQSLQELNPVKDRASNSQIMFLCLHASGLTLIPISIIATRALPLYKGMAARDPTDIFIPCMIATFVATMASLIMVSIRQRIRLFQPVIMAWVLGLSAFIALLVVYLNRLRQEEVQIFSTLWSNLIILAVLLLIVLGGIYKKINIFDAFIEGAKGGFETAVRIIPYLVGILAAVSLLRTSGSFDMIIDGFKALFGALGTDTRFVDGLPTAFIKPLSGGGARAMMIDTMRIHGPDSFAGRLASILQGTAETTFYVLAVYFGAVSVKNTRYTAGVMLLADLVGIITSIILAYLFFGHSAQ